MSIPESRVLNRKINSEMISTHCVEGFAAARLIQRPKSGIFTANEKLKVSHSMVYNRIV